MGFSLLASCHVHIHSMVILATEVLLVLFIKGKAEYSWSYIQMLCHPSFLRASTPLSFAQNFNEPLLSSPLG